MDSAELKTKTLVSIGGLSSKVTDDMYDLAESTSLIELRWSLPTDIPFQQLWMVKRCTRHIIDIFLNQSAEGVSHKQTKHDQKFDHYLKLLKKLDDEFSVAIENNVSDFANVDVTKAFGTYADVGRVYDFLGRDITRFVK